MPLNRRFSKMATCCTPNCQKWTLLGFAIFFLLLGLVLVGFTDNIVNSLKEQELNVGSNDTTEYKLWEATPIPMYIEFYLFNWSNWQEVIDSNWTVKPHFDQMGPYTYSEKHYRKQVKFNTNHTLTYKTQRIWHFVPEKTKGSLDDNITMINPILVTIGNFVKYKHAIVKMGINFFLEEKNIQLTVTKTARQLIFDGYDDPLLDLLKKLHLRHINIPFNNFAWFADRNGSIEYDGIYNMFDGTDDVTKLGRLTSWNYNASTVYYQGNCGKIEGTSGELWYPVQDDETVEIFSPDLCSTITLKRDGEFSLYGVTGHKFTGSAKVFDNGTAYPDMRCFSPGEVLPSGVRNVSECKFSAPAFVSFPHFYLADPYYRDAITGMKPNATEHGITVAIEPETGIPLQATVAAQINLRLERIDRIKLLENVKLYFMPSMWFKQYATLTEDYASQAKLLIILPSVGEYTGYGAFALAAILFSGLCYLVWKRYKGSQEEALLVEDEPVS